MDIVGRGRPARGPRPATSPPRPEASGHQACWGDHAIAATKGKTRIECGHRIAETQPSMARSTVGNDRGDRLRPAADSSGGWNPTVHLFSQAKGKLALGRRARLLSSPTSRCRRPSARPGSANGTFGLGASLSKRVSPPGKAAATASGHRKSKGRKKAQSSRPEDHDMLPARFLWHITPNPAPRASAGKALHRLCRTIPTAADLQLALREGYRSIEHVKRFTTTGMATDQGKTARTSTPSASWPTSLGPPPARGRGDHLPPALHPGLLRHLRRPGRRTTLLDPMRKTPMHSWHESHGAQVRVTSDSGGGPGTTRRTARTMHGAVNREVAGGAGIPGGSGCHAPWARSTSKGPMPPSS